MSNHSDPPAGSHAAADRGSGSGSAFPTTHWTLVGRAHKLGDPGAREAMTELVRAYLPALKAHLVARRRRTPEQADDLLQDFVVEKLLERNIVSLADPVRGKFRTFLLTTLDRFTIDAARRDGAAKRSPDRHAGASVDVHDNADVIASRPCEPSDEFDRAWARRVLDESIARMQRECNDSARPHLWGLFERRVLWPTIHGQRAEPLAAIVERFGLESAEQASNQLSTAKRIFARVFRSVIGEYTADDNELDAEVRDLWAILSSAKAQ